MLGTNPKLNCRFGSLMFVFRFICLQAEIKLVYSNHEIRNISFLEQFGNFGLQKCFLRFLEFAVLSLMLLPKTLSIPSAWASPETSMKSVRRSPQKIIRRQLASLEVYFHSIGVNMPEYRKPPVDEAPK